MQSSGTLNGDHDKMTIGNMKSMWVLLLSVTLVAAVVPSSGGGAVQEADVLRAERGRVENIFN